MATRAAGVYSSTSWLPSRRRFSTTSVARCTPGAAVSSNSMALPVGTAPKGRLCAGLRESKRRLRATGSVTAAARGSAQVFGPMSSCGRPPAQARRSVCSPLNVCAKLAPWPKPPGPMVLASFQAASAILNSCRPSSLRFR